MFKGRSRNRNRSRNVNGVGAGRSGPTKLYRLKSGLEFQTIPSFLSADAEYGQGRLAPHMEKGKNLFTTPSATTAATTLSSKHGKRSTEFNYKRSGGRFTLATSPIETSKFSKLSLDGQDGLKPVFVKETSGNKYNKIGKENERTKKTKTSVAADYKIASEVLKVVSKYATKKGKELSKLCESEVLELLTKSINSTLNTPFAYQAILSFAMNEYTDELLRFYKEITQCNKLYKGLFPFDVAEKLYEEYIAADARSEINVSGVMKTDVEKALEKARPLKQYVDVAAFDAVIFETRALIEDQTFRRFKSMIRDSADFADDVWLHDGVHSQEFKNDASTAMLYKLFQDIHVGLNKLKSLVAQTRKDSERRAWHVNAKVPTQQYVYHKRPVLPSRLRDLRPSDY